jgi:hypothetical protein
MKQDGRIGGEPLLKARGQTAEVTAATSNAHFTVSTGEPVMCAIIFAAGKMTQELQLGVNIQVPLVEGDDSLRGNYGPGKQYPGAPTCKFRGKVVPPFICCSPKGGIISELLRAMLKGMDSLDLFPCTDGGPPLSCCWMDTEADFNCPLCGMYEMCNMSGRFALASQMEQHTGKSETPPSRMVAGKWRQPTTKGNSPNSKS